LTWKAQR